MSGNTKATRAIQTPGQLLTTEQVAALLCVSTRTVQRLAKQGQLQQIKLGRGITRFSQDAITVFIDGKASFIISGAKAPEQHQPHNNVINFRRAKAAPSTGVAGSPVVFSGKTGAK
jgi:excisionase family DNA binding protein